MKKPQLIEYALSYADAGVPIFPCQPNGKTPACPRGFKDATADREAIAAWWQETPRANIGLATGAPSGVFVLDVDPKNGGLGTLMRVIGKYGKFPETPRAETGGGGWHYFFKLPEGGLPSSGGRVGPGLDIRGDGGYVVAPPSVHESGREYLWEIDGCLLDTPPAEAPPWLIELATPPPAVKAVVDPEGDRPGDEYGRAGDIREVLARHGWSPSKTTADGNEHWTRPGKTQGTSATLKDRVFYVFSGDAPPFEAGKPYGAFAVFALLEHAGDYAAASTALREMGYGGGRDNSDIDLSNIAPPTESAPDPPPPGPVNPGALPLDSLRCPGFITDMVNHTLATAPYPNVVMAFCGAVALLSFLAGRKYQSPSGIRSNMYILALAMSSSGKDIPRKINAAILHKCGLLDHLGDKFSSGQGIQDALLLTPAMLFQTDEIDALLRKIAMSRDGQQEDVTSTLLSMFSSSDTHFAIRRKAGMQKSPGTINQPSLTILGTATPSFYYQALSAQLLRNGFISRTLVFESLRREDGQDTTDHWSNIPLSIMSVADGMAKFQPGGNLAEVNPEPSVVGQTDGGSRALAEVREHADAQYRIAEAALDDVGTTVWGRAWEHTSKLALIHAISLDWQNPRIDQRGVRWAHKIVKHLIARMLFQAGSHVAESPFHAECLRVLRFMDEAGGTIRRSSLLRRMHMKAKTLTEIMESLEEQQKVVCKTETKDGRRATTYTLSSPGDK